MKITCIHCHHFRLLVSFYFINNDHLVNINVRYYKRFHLWLLPVAVLFDTIVSATTAHEQQHGTYTKFDQGSTIGEVKV